MPRPLARGGPLLTFAVSLIAAGCSSSSSDAPEDDGGPPPGPEQEVEIIRPLKLTPQGRVPENDPAYESVEIFSDRLVFHYVSEPTIALEKDNVVAGGNEQQGYLRRITAVATVADNTVEVVTEPAFLGDFILEGAFRLGHRPKPERWQQVSGDIFGQSSALTEDSYSIFDKTVSEDKAVTCKVGGAASIKLDPSFDIDLDFDIEVDIDAGILPPHGELKYAIFAVSGSIEAGAEATISGQLSANCVADFIKYLRERRNNRDLFKYQLKPIRTPTAIPIIITHHIEPVLRNKMEAKVSIAGLTLGGKAKLALRAGSEYKDGEWHEIWEPEADGDAWVKLADESGEFELSNTFTIGLQYMAFVYDTAGPKLGITASGAEKLTANLQTCKWTAGLYYGVDVIYGAQTQIPVIHKPLWEYEGKMSLLNKPILEETGDIPYCGEDAGVDAGLDATVSPDISPDVTTGPAEIIVTNKGCQPAKETTYYDQAAGGWLKRAYCSWTLANNDGNKGWGCGLSIGQPYTPMTGTDGKTEYALFEILHEQNGVTKHFYVSPQGTTCFGAGPDSYPDYPWGCGCWNSYDLYINVGLLPGETATVSIASVNEAYYTYTGGPQPLTATY